MEAYTRMDRPKDDTPMLENEVRVMASSQMRNYITYALALLEKGHESVVLKAMGRAINKTVSIAEILKRRLGGLHQITEVGSINITDVWEPKEEGLNRLEITRHVSLITITLATTQLDVDHPGYQAPLPLDQVQSTDIELDINELDLDPRRHGRRGGGARSGGGRGRGRGRGRNPAEGAAAGGDVEGAAHAEGGEAPADAGGRGVPGEGERVRGRGRRGGPGRRPPAGGEVQHRYEPAGGEAQGGGGEGGEAGEGGAVRGGGRRRGRGGRGGGGGGGGEGRPPRREGGGEEEGGRPPRRRGGRGRGARERAEGRAAGGGEAGAGGGGDAGGGDAGGGGGGGEMAL